MLTGELPSTDTTTTTTTGATDTGTFRAGDSGTFRVGRSGRQGLSSTATEQQQHDYVENGGGRVSGIHMGVYGGRSGAGGKQQQQGEGDGEGEEEDPISSDSEGGERQQLSKARSMEQVCLGWVCGVGGCVRWVCGCGGCALHVVHNAV